MISRSFVVPLFFDKKITIYRYSPFILEETTISDSIFDPDRVRFFIDRYPDVVIREKDEISCEGYNFAVISATLVRDHHWEIIATKQIT